MAKNNANTGDRPTCGAKTRAGTPCQKEAGWGTKNVGTPGKRCRLHGGNAGAPKGNRNSVKTGEHVTIFLDQLDPDEQELFAQVADDKRKNAMDELRLVTIRERRMLALIAKTREAMNEEGGDGLAIVEVTTEVGAPGEGGDGEEPETLVPGVKTKTKRRTLLDTLLAQEDALTRVQAHKVRLIELLHKMDVDTSSEEGSEDGLNALAGAIAESAKLLAATGQTIPQIIPPKRPE
jgi:hypothetical protein